jgi:ribosomal protein L24E
LIKRGSGIYTIANDGRAVLSARKKERLLIARKIDPRVVRWSVPCRERLGKQSKAVEAKERAVSVQKPKLTVGFKQAGVPNRLFVSGPRKDQDGN